MRGRASLLSMFSIWTAMYLRSRTFRPVISRSIASPDVAHMHHRRFREEFDRTDERERIHWMELLLKHYVPNISLELQSLRERALEISKSSTTGQVKSGQSNEIMSIGLAEDTEFAISPQSNTTTRESGLLQSCDTVFVFYTNELTSLWAKEYAGELSYVSLSMRMQQVIHQSLRNTLPEVLSDNLVQKAFLSKPL